MFYLQQSPQGLALHPDVLSQMSLLLVDELPSLALWEKRMHLMRQKAPALIFFFNNSDQNCIGMAAIERETILQAPKGRFFKRQENIQLIRLSNWGVTGRGYFFKPEFDLEGFQSLLTLPQKLQSQQEGVAPQFYQLKIDQNCFERLVDIAGIYDHNIRTFPISHRKKLASYEDYVYSLPESSTKSIFQLWKNIDDHTLGLDSIKVRKYQNFKDIEEHINYSTWGRILPHPDYLHFCKDEAFLFVSLEKRFSPQILLLFHEGHGGRLFLEFFIAKDCSIPNAALTALQYALMLFYKLEKYRKLLFLNAQELVGAEDFDLHLHRMMDLTLCLEEKTKRDLRSYSAI